VLGVIVRSDELVGASWRERRAERRRLKRLDALGRRMAELHAVQDLLARSAGVVGRGWIQGAWFNVSTPQGTRAVNGYNLRLVRDHPVTGACLVGAIVYAAGGPAAVRSQLVQRTLDVTWHALREEDVESPVRWCPSPAVRQLHLQELTAWNDAQERTPGEVAGLLARAEQMTGVQRERAVRQHREMAATPA
jgi:hypothetical protein